MYTESITEYSGRRPENRRYINDPMKKYCMVYVTRKVRFLSKCICLHQVYHLLLQGDLIIFL